MPVRAGIIGVGVMGAEHARLLTAEVAGSAVAAVYDVDAARAASVAAFTGAAVRDDPMVLIKDDDVDWVLVASSDATHAQFVLAALAEGKPVLCEKPLSPDVPDCRRVVEADDGRRLVGVGFMRRFDPGYLAMRQAIDDGAVGRPLVLHCVHRNAASPGTTPQSRITSSAVHEIDVCRWLLGAEIVDVTAHDVAVHDEAERNPLLLTLRADSGAIVDVEIFVGARYGYDVHCELVGETGAVSLDWPVPTVTRVSGAVGHAVAHDWRDRFADAYRRELQACVDAVRSGAPLPAATAWDGYVATAVADTAIQALRSGRRERVRLDLAPAS